MTGLRFFSRSFQQTFMYIDIGEGCVKSQKNDSCTPKESVKPSCGKKGTMTLHILVTAETAKGILG